MKRKLLIFILLISVFICENVYANPYKKMETIDGVSMVSCTYYAWKQANDKAHVSLPSWGNAKNWYSKAKQAGYKVGKEPKANSIAVWKSTTNNYGHVAYVVSVDEYFITLNEGGIYEYINESTDSPDWKAVAHDGTGIYNGNAIDRDGSRKDLVLIGYIYLDSVPETPTTKTTSTKTTTTTKKKSSNNYLSSITIKDISFDFNKDVLEYNLEVEYNQDNVVIEVIPEDKLASVSLDDTYPLEVGNNKIIIKVIAEDTTPREYIININRKEEITTTKVEYTSNEEKNDTKKKFPIILIIVIPIILIISIILLLRKK